MGKEEKEMLLPIINACIFFGGIAVGTVAWIGDEIGIFTLSDTMQQVLGGIVGISGLWGISTLILGSIINDDTSHNTVSFYGICLTIVIILMVLQLGI